MNTPSGNSEEKRKQPAQERHSSLGGISWAKDRERLAEQIGALISWRREEGFPEDTDHEMIVGILNLIEARRLHNLKVYRRLISEAVTRGESGEKAALEILRTFLRNARSEVETIEGMVDDQDRAAGNDRDTPT